MGLYDCPKCWGNPCSCGYEYKDWSVEKKIELAAAALGIDEAILLERVNDIFPAKQDESEKK